MISIPYLLRVFARILQIPAWAEAWSLGLTYLRLWLKKQFVLRLLHRRIVRERVFQYQVGIFDYSGFLYMFEEIFVARSYEFEAATDAPVILDCGSNVGLSILYFKRRFPAARIMGFEPDPETFHTLVQNVEGNGLTDVRLVHAACVDWEGEVELYRDQAGGLTASLRRERQSGMAIRVPAVVLSRFVEGPVDFLKMDIEGAEWSVLRELADRNKLKLINQMVIEYHHHITPEEDCLGRVLGLLEEHGFGYQIGTAAGPPIPPGQFQDILIHAYRMGLAAQRGKTQDG